jgi:hypothetical protein
MLEDHAGALLEGSDPDNYETSINRCGIRHAPQLLRPFVAAYHQLSRTDCECGSPAADRGL